MMTDERLIKLFSPYIELDIFRLENIKKYASELKAWNLKSNLTALKADEEIFVNHFLDSFSILRFIDKSDAKLLDVGSGGGFPGCALKLILAGLKLTLIDSSGKKIAFLNHIIKYFNMQETEALWCRAEDAAVKPLYREQFDFVTARAVAEMPVLAELCLPFVKTGGLFIAQKGRDEDEINSSKAVFELLGGKLENIIKIKLPGDTGLRQAVLIRKIKPTPPGYPRKRGIPNKKPLKA
ncbi:MAG: 16S rRNA (guanine(527)-N(7))-methyltransferase RsmG [Candidatus Firestonebacteria bacterium]